MIDLDQTLTGLPEPRDLSRPSDRLIGELLSHVPEPAVMAYAITLLAGDDPARFPTALRYMGGAHADILLANRDFALWPVIWGARAMQYVWTPGQAAGAARLILAHLTDERWRVAEMCSKVVGKRQLSEGADGLVRLADHRLPRVRAQAVRALGSVGEREHLPVLHRALGDEDRDVRRAAARAMELRATQLDLDPDNLLRGRFDH
jgi:hypothetical protein